MNRANKSILIFSLYSLQIRIILLFLSIMVLLLFNLLVKGEPRLNLRWLRADVICILLYPFGFMWQYAICFIHKTRPICCTLDVVLSNSVRENRLAFCIIRNCIGFRRTVDLV